MLERTLAKADLWARRHAARYAPEKFELIYFKNPRADIVMEEAQTLAQLAEADPYNINTAYPRGNDQMAVRVPGRDPLKPVQQAKYLGIWLDKTLFFDKHRVYTMTKANSSLEALRGVTGSTWGVSLPGMRKIYQAVVVPQLLYGLSAWFCPATGALPARERNRITAAFARIQKRAAIIGSGAFKGTSGEALDVELFLRPMA